MPGGLSWEIVASIALHAIVGVTLSVAKCSESRPPPMVQEVLLVSTGPAKQTTRMPQKAERAPDPVKGASTPAAEPPPVRQSDLALKTPDAPEVKGANTANLERERLIAEMERKQALSNLDAPLGTTDRPETSPDSTLNPEDALGGTAGSVDPLLARWAAAARQMVNPNWHPLGALCRRNPSGQVQIAVDVGPGGELLGEPKVHKSSGDVSIDEAARNAVELTGKLPAPPRQPWPAAIQFKNKDCP